jgi:hypothetical protein
LVGGTRMVAPPQNIILNFAPWRLIDCRAQ